MTKVILSVNERKIPLKDFMQEMLANIIQGYLKTTKGVPEKIENIVKGIVSAYGADYTFEYNRGTGVLVNDEAMTKHVQDVGRKLLGDGAVHDYVGTFGGEDFAEYLLHVPGCFFRLGCAQEGIEQESLHHPKFNPDERALIYGSAVLAGIIAGFG